MKRGRSTKQDLRPLPFAGEGGPRVSEGRERGRAQSSDSPSPASKSGGNNPAAPPRGDLVLVGEFGRAQGLKGEVRLKSYTGDPKAIAGYRPLIAADGRLLSLKSVRPAPGAAADMLIAQVDGVTTREAAEALNRVQIYLTRDKLPPPDEEDEFLLADLIGLTVRNEAGEIIGTVVDVPNYGGGDLLEIAPIPNGATALLPFTKAFVPVVDVAAKRIVAVPPDDLFEPSKPEPDPEDEA